MTQGSNSDLTDALKLCDSEPIHIPGCIQSCGALIALNVNNLSIAYASENCGHHLGRDAVDLFGSAFSSLVPPECELALRNALAADLSKPMRVSLGSFPVNGTDFHISASRSDNHAVIEFEPTATHGNMDRDQFDNFSDLMGAIQNAQSVQSLMDTLVSLFSDLSSFDRVMVYRFDADWNGEVIAEQHSAGQEPYLGLRFPSSDIPAQARDFMTKFPVRFIADAKSEQIPILAATATLPPLDITYAQLRGTSPIHLQYLVNMGTATTMTTSLMVDERLWGILSFHHRSPKIPSVTLRQICTSIAPILNLKMQALEQAERAPWLKAGHAI